MLNACLDQNVSSESAACYRLSLDRSLIIYLPVSLFSPAFQASGDGTCYGGTQPVERGNTSCGLDCSYLRIPLLGFIDGVNTNAEAGHERRDFNPTK